MRSILDGTPEVARALAASDPGAWKELLEHVVQHPEEAAPAAFVEALLRVDPDVEAWMARAKERAAQTESTFFTTLIKALRPFKAWFIAGVAASREGTDASGLAAQWVEVLADTSPDRLEHTRQFVADLPESADVDLRARASMLLARRYIEAGHGREAIEHAERAEAIFAAAHRVADVRAAQRVRGAAALRMGAFEQGFAILEPLLGVAGPRFGGEGSKVLCAIADPREAALDELAAFALRQTRTSTEWVRALGEVAEVYVGTEHATHLSLRFEGALAAMVKDAPVALAQRHLETVIREARERELTYVVRAAERLASSLVT